MSYTLTRSPTVSSFLHEAISGWRVSRPGRWLLPLTLPPSSELLGSKGFPQRAAAQHQFPGAKGGLLTSSNGGRCPKAPTIRLISSGKVSPPSPGPVAWAVVRAHGLKAGWVISS
ncbi:hypothetical protein VaNZ11_016281 [Volvox africanus]|uniref:Uncharacterized protein n=1 Tax=Volvox africanus TaxID=51714 RepID=A0ABQ5SN17_9CHLO|nr:hypothetical protein VaNZ11_016281 [Volvox africanus]